LELSLSSSSIIQPISTAPLFTLLARGGAPVAQPAEILLVDNDDVSARFLQRWLTREGHAVTAVRSAADALQASRVRRPDLILLDLVAQGAGFKLCRQLKEEPATRLIPIVIVTSESDRADRLRGLDAGADDFLIKPFDPAELRARIRSLVRLKRYTDELESAEAIILGLGATIEARDPCTRGHCQRLAKYATTLGEALALDRADLSALERGAFLHDIGKIAVPDSVLLKHGKLDPMETRVMREHPLVGDALCAGLRSLTAVRPIVRHHHERLDGSGYPDGLRNGAVPLLAQIVAVVDVYDALTSERPYHAPIDRHRAFEMLADEVEKGWRDRELVNAFVRVAQREDL
jgi:putative two-component system response regulator